MQLAKQDVRVLSSIYAIIICRNLRRWRKLIAYFPWHVASFKIAWFGSTEKSNNHSSTTRLSDWVGAHVQVTLACTLHKTFAQNFTSYTLQRLIFKGDWWDRVRVLAVSHSLVPVISKFYHSKQITWHIFKIFLTKCISIYITINITNTWNQQHHQHVMFSLNPNT